MPVVKRGKDCSFSVSAVECYILFSFCGYSFYAKYVLFFFFLSFYCILIYIYLPHSSSSEITAIFFNKKRKLVIFTRSSVVAYFTFYVVCHYRSFFSGKILMSQFTFYLPNLRFTRIRSLRWLVRHWYSHKAVLDAPLQKSHTVKHRKTANLFFSPS